MILVGLEPTISGSVDRCLIHWATGPDETRANGSTAPVVVRPRAVNVAQMSRMLAKRIQILSGFSGPGSAPRTVASLAQGKRSGQCARASLVCRGSILPEGSFEGF
jgi:hypothetical protein